ncbi:hypothetical protein N7488_001699 [Penicillium malachiteum]|nr:hypothetical protein N7488_001699 [Penicillium malachiteum]
MPSLLRSLPLFGRRWTPLNFSKPNFVRIPASQKIEEETIPGYVAARYYPTRIGEILQSRYQVVGKLGFGTSSTVWLARDMDYRRYVTLKIFIKSASLGQQLDDELNICKRMGTVSQKHPGHKYVRSLLDSFDLDGPEDKHRCLRLPTPILIVMLHRLFLALDYLQLNAILNILVCVAVLTSTSVLYLQGMASDIKADNIMFGIGDDSVFREFEENELHDPCSRKELDGRTIYISRELGIPKDVGAPVLCEFGSAVLGEEKHTEDIQPNIYRSPEVILGVPWTYSVDIWNVGCMIWDIFEGGSLFTGQDPELHTYRSRAHLAEMIRLLGPPPPSLLARGDLTRKFFSEEGNFCDGIPIQEHTPLEEKETTLEGQEKEKFLCLVRKMLQREPEKRSSAKELEEDEWVQTELRK